MKRLAFAFLVLLTALLLVRPSEAATPMTPVKIVGSYGFYFNGRDLFKIVSVKIYDNLFTKLYIKTPLKNCEGMNACSIYYQGIMNFYPALGTLVKFLQVKFKVMTTVPPQYAALKKMLGPLADDLFVMCVVTPRPELAAKTVAGSVAKFLAYNMRTFYFFAIAPYNIWLKPGDTVTLTYFLSTSPTDVSLYGRRMIGNQPCPWGSLYYAPVPVVYNVGGITNITMSWGWAVPYAVKPVGYWDYPKPAYYVFNVKGSVAYPASGTYTPQRGPSGLITVPPMYVTVSVTAYPTRPYNIKLPGGYTGAVLESFEVTFARKCPGDVDLDGKYTMKDFEVIGCMTGVIQNKTYCDALLSTIPPQLKDIISILGDFDQNGVLNQNDALILLNYIGRKCPAADYTRYTVR